MSLGDKLRSLRVKNRKTLLEQGRLLGVSLNSVYRWEHDLSVPRKPTLRIIATCYNVPLDWLLSEESSASLVSESELGLLDMYRQLPDQSRFKVLGYLERMALEDYNLEDLFSE